MNTDIPEENGIQLYNKHQEQSLQQIVSPTLEYCTAVLDPYAKHSIKKHTRAARFISHNYTRTPGVAAGSVRYARSYAQNHNLMNINKRKFLQAVHARSTSDLHNCKVFTIHTYTNSYKLFWFPRVMRDRNRLPQHIIETRT